MEKKKILIIDQHSETQAFFEVMFSREFDVLNATNGVSGLEMARANHPNLILVDEFLPILSGYDTCSLLKQDNRTKEIPIIFLSTRKDILDLTQGKTSKADDYFCRPFDYKELLNRVRAHLKKQADDAERIEKPLMEGNLKLDLSKRELFLEDKKVHLTFTEFEILRLFLIHSGNVVTRDLIVREVWEGRPYLGNDRTIDVHVHSIRRKVPSLADRIISIYGVGYKYER